MPATTANRGYPYSVPADNNDVAGALQALAESVDADLVQLTPSIVARRAARVSRSATMTLKPTSPIQSVSWDTLEFNNRGALGAFPQSSPWQITPQYPGFWVVTSTIAWQTNAGGPVIASSTQFEYELDKNNTRIARVSREQNEATNDITGRLAFSVAAGNVMNGTTDYFRTSASYTSTDWMTLHSASMTLWQMTEA